MKENRQKHNSISMNWCTDKWACVTVQGDIFNYMMMVPSQNDPWSLWEGTIISPGCYVSTTMETDDYDKHYILQRYNGLIRGNLRTTQAFP